LVVKFSFDINKDQEMENLGVQYEAMETIFKSADIISLHCPLNDNTKHINKSSLLQMKDNIMLINTSRGALINTTDIIEALKMVKLVI
jgi:D-lactate dehydrogenase